MSKLTFLPAAERRRPLRVWACLSTLLAVVATDVPAFDVGDPFAVGNITPPRPGLPLDNQDATVAPCGEPAAEATLGALAIVDLALCRNPSTREMWASARVQAAQVGAAQAAWLPTLTGQATVGRLRSNSQSETQRSAAMTLSWLLFDFGARSANLEVARQTLIAASATLDATVHTVFLSALQAYYNAQAARAAVVAAQQSESASRESLTAATVRYQVGTGTPADRLQAQTAWSQATLNRIRAEGVLRNALGSVANVIGLDANTPVQLDELPAAAPDASFEGKVARLIEEARAQRPDLRAAEAALSAARAGVDYAHAAYRPTISLGGGPSWQDVGGLSGTGNSLILTLTVPIFSRFESTYGIRRAEATSDMQAARRDAVRLQVAFDVWEAYQNFTTATQSLASSADLLASAEQSERVALGRYKAGVGNILDLLNAQSALATARMQRIQATLDWHFSRATLAKAVGTLDRGLLPTARGNTKARSE